jgi:hypothetical protein
MRISRGLQRLGVEWFCGIEVTSERLIQHYVASSYGIGLTVAVPGFKPTATARTSVIGLHTCGSGCCVVSQAFRYHAPTTCGTRRRSRETAGANPKSGSRSVATSFSRVRP